MRYLRFFLFVVFALLFNILIVPPFILISLITRKDRTLFAIYKIFLKISFFILGIRVKVLGIENIPEPPFIIAPNHTSYLDPPALIMVISYNIRAMAKKSVFNIPILGIALSIGKFIKVDRSSASRASKSFREAEKLLKSGIPLMIFPEGTRTYNGNLQRFKGGVARLSLKSGVPVVPTVIKGGFELLPRTANIPKPGEILIKFLPPIYPDKFNDASELNIALRSAIEDALG
ncbi:MAG TPA: 1-acyl-sn-glycerol-3-phosphate acyltransferase [candidate division WOR-3 bacterium]|uniref:1-acyl-sn-glycerol-3-phosphate acyltransferase n=1 Tax=candidate division WOR-3 bacterium TaxID=2052148 RepID=A0A7C5DF39_UNCW3|nr:1-acyl-sn-glycerol-3-phosphate acyltransferase [candidate division WOR-3 bacterium]